MVDCLFCREKSGSQIDIQVYFHNTQIDLGKMQFYTRLNYNKGVQVAERSRVSSSIDPTWTMSVVCFDQHLYSQPPDKLKIVWYARKLDLLSLARLAGLRAARYTKSYDLLFDDGEGAVLPVPRTEVPTSPK